MSKASGFGYSLVAAATIMTAALARPQANDKPPTTTDAETGYYCAVYRPGPAWVTGRSMTDQPEIHGHFAHMTKLQERQHLVLGGPFTDDSGAMALFVFPNQQSAERAITADPIVSSGVVTVRIHPWHAAVGGTVK